MHLCLALLSTFIYLTSKSGKVEQKSILENAHIFLHTHIEEKEQKHSTPKSHWLAFMWVSKHSAADVKVRIAFSISLPNRCELNGA